MESGSLSDCATFICVEDGVMPRKVKTKKPVSDQAPASLHKSIRPVRVDDQGRIFEMTGEQIVMPGLEPDTILRALKDARLGRTRSLKEMIASRNHDGISHSSSIL
jgi:hypothetical protein